MHDNPISTGVPPRFSIVIAAYNDWGPLEECLRALSEQNGGVQFEIIVVDDGSLAPAPESIREWARSCRLSIVRQEHAGIPTARNRGVQTSKGEVLVFTDADCRFQANCLSALDAALVRFPQHHSFQLHLVGHSSTLLGRAEDLRLVALQDHLLQTNGCIRYLNTAGFAIRRERIGLRDNLFEPAALRSEDTLLLAHLMQKHEMPVFVPDAIVQHTIQLSFVECVRKDLHVAWLDAKTFELIAAKGVRTRMENRHRLHMLRAMWRLARQPSIGRAAWIVLVSRQMVQRMVSLTYRVLRVGSKKEHTSNASNA